MLILLTATQHCPRGPCQGKEKEKEIKDIQIGGKKEDGSYYQMVWKPYAVHNTSIRTDRPSTMLQNGRSSQKSTVLFHAPATNNPKVRLRKQFHLPWHQKE